MSVLQNTKVERRARRWFVRVAMHIILLGFGFVWMHCQVPRFSLEGRPCALQAPVCADGYRCDGQTRTCVALGQEPSDGMELVSQEEVTGPESEPQLEPQVESQPEQQVEPSPEEIVVEREPDQTEPTCGFTSPKPVLSCPVSASRSCERFAEVFSPYPASLQEAVSGAAMITTGFARSSLQPFGPAEFFVYVVGGSTTGAAGAKVWVSKVNDQKAASAWKSVGTLLNARKSPVLWWWNDYLYVGGGVDAQGNPVQAVERALRQTDGTLGTFEDVGKIGALGVGSALTYTRGFVYVMGGRNAKGELQASVARYLIQPDGKLSAAIPLPPLPLAMAGKSVAVGHFLYFLPLAPSAERKIYVSRLLPSAEIEAWCPTSKLPPDVVSFEVVAGLRWLFLLGAKKRDGKYDAQVYFAPLQGSTGTGSFEGSLQTWFCSAHSSVSALLSPVRGEIAAAIGGDLLLVIGGKDAQGNVLNVAQWSPLQFRADSQCDMDLDNIPNFSDFCPGVYSTENKNSDQPSGIIRPGQTGWNPRMGLGDACEQEGMKWISAGAFTRGNETSADAPKQQVTL
ncbi:MAG: hypothetical protein AAGJ35_02020, partial [Myxococcota bacterium]